jgi:predicted anti-sigma-YlaC factor YlaD
MRLNSSNCQRVRIAVSLDLDGGSSELERAFLNAHVANCDACAAYCDDVVSTTSLLRSQPLEPLVHGVTLTFTRTSWRERSLRLGTSAAAGLILVGLLSATQFSLNPRTVSHLRSDATRAAGTSKELKEIYDELSPARLVSRQDKPSFLPTGRVR